LGPLLKSMLHDPSNEVRLSAAWALRHFSKPVLAKALLGSHPLPTHPDEINQAMAHEQWRVRWFASLLAAMPPHPALLPALLQLALHDEQVVVRCSAILSLLGYTQTTVAEELCTLLGDINDHVKIEAATVLSLKGYQQAVPALVRQLQAFNENVRIAMLTALGALGGSEVIPHLLNALEDTHELVRINAAMALFEVVQKAAYEPNLSVILMRRLEEDPNPYVVRNIVRILGLVGDEQTVKQIVAMLKAEKRPEVIVNLVQALGSLGGPHALKPLVRLLRHEQWEVRFQVVKSLAALNDQRAYSPLLHTLQDTSMLVKEQAVYALGVLKDKRAIAHLEKLRLQHPYGNIQKAISNALDRLLMV
jgi:HEAT repeat protein